ncbi:MAG: hypothetical protein H7A36_02485 [Chlamydiales bacterium]|nr:hypothetical protein [Chlamydiales bacterium]
MFTELEHVAQEMKAFDQVARSRLESYQSTGEVGLIVTVSTLFGFAISGLAQKQNIAQRHPPKEIILLSTTDQAKLCQEIWEAIKGCTSFLGTEILLGECLAQIQNLTGVQRDEIKDIFESGWFATEESFKAFQAMKFTIEDSPQMEVRTFFEEKSPDFIYLGFEDVSPWTSWLMEHEKKCMALHMCKIESEPGLCFFEGCLANKTTRL